MGQSTDYRDVPAITRHFQSASSDMLAAVLDQSMDCIKVIGPTGQLDFMNRNGRCAMEIDDFAMVAGRNWWDLWPEESQHLVRDAVERARRGESHRFEAFCPTAKGSPRWWEVAVSPLTDSDGNLQGIVSVSRDITDRVTARELRDATAAEMRHRLQNAYALTGAIITASAKGDPAREAFAADLLSRLDRLGAAQRLLLEPGNEASVQLSALLGRLLEPFCTSTCQLRFGKLPDLTLGEDEVRTLALIIGELSTNSNKYGALGHGGTISVRASVNDGALRILWSEQSDGPPPDPSRLSGSGTRLIARTLTARGGSMEQRWRAHGLDVVVTLPIG